MTFTRYLVRRFGQLVIVLVLIACVNFVILHSAPGDLVDVLAGESGAADQEYLEHLRAVYGLDEPLYVQLGHYLWALARFDLGYAFRYNMPVQDLILSRLPATLLLMLTSLGVALAGGIAFGLAAARKPRSFRDMVISVLSLIAYSTPLFWLGLMLIVLFSVKLDLLPSGGMQTIGSEQSIVALTLDVARHLIMPSITLGLFYMAIYTRLMRASVLEIYGMDFVRTARAKGLTGKQIMRRHVLGNSILPIVSLFGVKLGSVLGGAVVVEVVFAWPGLGTLAYDAIFQRDLNLLMGILVLSSLLVVMVNLVVDVLYTWLDPRIELTSA